ncbi:P-loop NTPase fold protein [Dickeya sp. NCPPB 3274]|uniref:KAP family P-loop NTPase fold protein n=1 Tax=Dickeya sp. NCPPB 3274 TaxID=568766 RepID=UPI0003A3D77E|nr:P-loop NTPase fold protein [Dickeya sp. NCPPB 3274]
MVLGKELNFNWEEEVDIELDGEKETLPPDTLDRRKYAEYLYFYLSERKSKNTVVNLNAEWGAGKTYFLKRLYTSIKEKHPCIYIDAWKQDFSDDAFLTLFSSLINQIETYSGRIDAKLIRAAEAIGRFTKGVIPEITSAVIKQYVGIDDIAKIAQTASKLMLEQHQKKLKSIATLKKELGFWSDLAFNKGYEAPVFIFIDELDRCRPDYAISLLEIVKHIFSVDNFIFVIATDTEQLQHSIKNVYGEGFDANLYLSRFFHRRFSLHAPDIKTLVSTLIRDRIKDDFEEIHKTLFPINDMEDMTNNCASIMDAIKMNIRDSIKTIDRFCDIIKSQKSKNIDYILLLTMLSLNEMDKSACNVLTGIKSRKGPWAEFLLGNDKLFYLTKNTVNITMDSSPSNTGVDKLIVNDYVSQRNPTTKEVINLTFCKLIEQVEFQMARCELINSPNLEDKKQLITIYDSQQKHDNQEKINFQIYGLWNKNKKNFHTIKNYIDFMELAVAFD